MSEATASAVAYWESKGARALALAATAPHLRHYGKTVMRKRKPGPPCAVRSPTMEEQIRAERAAGATLPALAIKYRTHYRTLYRILGGAARPCAASALDGHRDVPDHPA